jgi:hypothetical protein
MGGGDSGRHTLSGRITGAYIDETYCPSIDGLSKEKE